MKSLGGRIAFFLFTVGFISLLYSINVFFNPNPSVTLATEEASVSRSPASEEKEGDGESAKVPEEEVKSVPPPAPPKPPQVQTPAEVRKIVRDQPLRLARAHLEGVGLKMSLPENLQFGETQDGDYQVLFGSNGQGKVGLLLFSTKQKMTADKFRAYFEAYVKDGLDIKTKGKGKPFPNRSGVGEMIQFAGTAARGDEFQAFYFQNKRSKRSHFLVLMDRQLSRHPAQIRVTLDSIR